MDTTVKLSKPFEYGGEKIESITLREPTVADIRRCGYPFSIETTQGASRVKFDTDAIFTYISRLGNIPPSYLEKNLSIGDFQKLQALVMDFFGNSGE